MEIKKIETAAELAEVMEKENAFLCLMPDQLYRNAPAMNHSLLKEYDKSPAHYKWRLNNPREDTAGTLIGRAFHCYALEGKAVFEATFVSAPKFDRRTKKGKEAAAEWEEAHKNQTSLTETDYEYVVNLGELYLKNTNCSKYTLGGVPEVAGFVKDVETDLWLKFKMDCWHPGKLVITDLKTTIKSAAPDSFVYTIRDYGYHSQAAFYTDCVEAVIGQAINAFVITAVEKAGPFAMKPYLLGDTFMDIGRQKYREWLTIHQKCLEEDKWPAYDAKLEILDAPEWMRL